VARAERFLPGWSRGAPGAEPRETELEASTSAREPAAHGPEAAERQARQRGRPGWRAWNPLARRIQQELREAPGEWVRKLAQTKLGGADSTWGPSGPEARPAGAQSDSRARARALRESSQWSLAPPEKPDLEKPEPEKPGRSRCRAWNGSEHRRRFGAPPYFDLPAARCRLAAGLSPPP